jgi:hypothetical protein
MKPTFRLFALFIILSGIIVAGCEPVEEDPTGSDIRDPFIGMWQFVENSSYKSTDAQSYVVSISKDPSNSSQVILKNFGNPGTQDISVIGLATSSQIVVSTQNMSNGWIVKGSGKISNPAKTTMSWTYSLIIAGSEEFFTANATKL